jgi:hypothetical protein
MDRVRGFVEEPTLSACILQCIAETGGDEPVAIARSAARSTTRAQRVSRDQLGPFPLEPGHRRAARQEYCACAIVAHAVLQSLAAALLRTIYDGSLDSRLRRKTRDSRLLIVRSCGSERACRCSSSCTEQFERIAETELPQSRFGKAAAYALVR